MIAAICWGILAAIHVLPALSLFQPVLISRLYSVESGSTTFLLLHHRAALFLVICVACVWAMLRPESQQLAAAAVSISMLSFLLLYWLNGSPGALRTIAVADLAGLPFLAFVAWQAFRPT